MNSRIIVCTLAAAGALLLACGGESGRAQTNEVLVGVVLPLSGPVAPIGQHLKLGASVAADEVNAAGGIKSLGGAKVRLIFGDSTGDAKVGVTEMEKLITRDKVSMVLGAYQSGVTLPMTTVAEKYSVPLMASGSEDQITDRGYKYVFRTNEKTSWRVRDQVRFLVETAKAANSPIATAALVYENTAWGQGAHRDWIKYLGEAGVKIVVDESYPNATSDLTPVVLKIKAAKPEAILYCSYVSDAILLMKTIAEMEVPTKAIIGLSGGTADPDFVPGAGKAVLHTFDASRWEPDFPRTGATGPMAAYKKLAGVDMDAESMKHYQYMMTMIAAVEKAGSKDPKKIRDALASLRLNAPHPAVRFVEDDLYFDQTGQIYSGQMVGVQFQEVGGKIERVTVWPSNVARKGSRVNFPMPTWQK